MTLLTNQLIEKEVLSAKRNTSTNKVSNEEFSIRMKTRHSQESAMPQELKNQIRKNAPSLYELFDQTLQKKGESAYVESRFVEENVLEVEGLSQMTLHGYILEAERLGKKIEYIKTTTVKISD